MMLRSRIVPAIKKNAVVNHKPKSVRKLEFVEEETPCVKRLKTVNDIKIPTFDAEMNTEVTPSTDACINTEQTPKSDASTMTTECESWMLKRFLGSAAVNGVLKSDLKSANKALDTLKVKTAQEILSIKAEAAQVIESAKAEATQSIEWAKVESAFELHRVKKSLEASHEKEMAEMKAKIAALEASIVDREKFYLKADGDRIEENRLLFESKEQHKLKAAKFNTCLKVANAGLAIMNKYIDKLPLRDVEAMQAEIDILRQVDVHRTRQGPAPKTIKRRVVVNELMNQMHTYEAEE